MQLPVDVGGGKVVGAGGDGADDHPALGGELVAVLSQGAGDSFLGESHFKPLSPQALSEKDFHLHNKQFSLFCQ
jgi:hypothetical protein